MESSSASESSLEKHDETAQSSLTQIMSKKRDRVPKNIVNGGFVFTVVTLAAAVLFFVFGFVMTIKKSYINNSMPISTVNLDPVSNIPIAGGQITNGIPIDVLLAVGEREDVEQTFENLEALNQALGMNLKEPEGIPFVVDEKNYYLLKNGAVDIEYIHGNNVVLTENTRIYDWVITSKNDVALENISGTTVAGYVLSDMTPVALAGEEYGEEGDLSILYTNGYWFDGQYYNVLSSLGGLQGEELDAFKELIEEINSLNSHK
ncbi:MAG: hypothetical protein IKG93_11075 [Clostridiales bacterium]|nr:hypothetical protein [Clostridiales bacterium]